MFVFTLLCLLFAIFTVFLVLGAFAEDLQKIPLCAVLQWRPITTFLLSKNFAQQFSRFDFGTKFFEVFAVSGAFRCFAGYCALLLGFLLQLYGALCVFYSFAAFIPGYNIINGI